MKYSKHRVWLGFTACLIPSAVADAQVPQQQYQQQQQVQPQGQALQAQRGAEQRPDVIATVNGDPITKKELDVTFQAQLQGMQTQLKDGQLDAEAAEKLRQQAFGKLVESRLVEQYVTEEGPKVEEQEVEKILNGAQEQVKAQGMKFDEFLASRGHTPKSFERRIEGSLAWEKYQQQEMTEEKLRQHFEQNKEQFPVQEYEQARPWIVQSYASQMWTAIVREASKDAEVEMTQQASPHSAEAVGPAFRE